MTSSHFFLIILGTLTITGIYYAIRNLREQKAARAAAERSQYLRKVEDEAYAAQLAANERRNSGKRPVWDAEPQDTLPPKVDKRTSPQHSTDSAQQLVEPMSLVNPLNPLNPVSPLNPISPLNASPISGTYWPVDEEKTKAVDPTPSESSPSPAPTPAPTSTYSDTSPSTSSSDSSPSVSSD